MSADSGEAGRAAAARKRVLLVDDHPVNRLVAQSLLEGLPVEIVLAFNGAQAVERYRDHGFDLVLMDIHMPVMDGVSAIRAIRAIERQRAAMPARIAVVSVDDGATVRREAREAGADDYLTKPVDGRALHALLAEASQDLGQ